MNTNDKLADLREIVRHCVSAADEGEDYCVSKNMLTALTELGFMAKVGRGRWAPTDAARTLAEVTPTLPIDIHGTWHEVQIGVHLHIINLRDKLAAKDAAPALAVEAPTGTPPRAWTEQERQDAQDAMRRIVDSEKKAPAVGGDVVPHNSDSMSDKEVCMSQTEDNPPATQGDAISPCLGCDSLACDDCRRRVINESEVAMDAERYRWLRDKACFGSRHDPAVLKDGPTDCCEFMFGEELDAAIDAAIAAQAGGE